MTPLPLHPPTSPLSSSLSWEALSEGTVTPSRPDAHARMNVCVHVQHSSWRDKTHCSYARTRGLHVPKPSLPPPPPLPCKLFLINSSILSLTPAAPSRPRLVRHFDGGSDGREESGGLGGGIGGRQRVRDALLLFALLPQRLGYRTL